jgi:hypothetical protein
VVTAIYANGVESGPSEEVYLGPPRIDAVRLRGSKLQIDGSGFTDNVEVFLDQFGFVRAAKAKGSVRIVQKGSLTNGASLVEYLAPGRRVLVSVRNSTGATTQINVTL